VRLTPGHERLIVLALDLVAWVLIIAALKHFLTR
jgi:hypothetical protein